MAANPKSGALRLHKLGGYANPNVFTIDGTPNHAYKISFEFGENGAVILRRVGTHKQLVRVA